VSKRTKFTIALIALILPLNEIWQVWKESNAVVNPWLALDYPLAIQWYFKFLGHSVSDVLKAIVVFRLSRMNQTLRLAARVYLIYTVFDLVMFFINFNKINYVLVYTLTGAVALLMWWVGEYEFGLMVREKRSAFRRWWIRTHLKARKMKHKLFKKINFA